MCGIAGIINCKNIALDKKILDEMLYRIEHRGPDDKRIHQGSTFLLGHLRLSIIDIEHGQQPMLSRDGRYVLVFNGEIYNYIELKKKLQKKGVDFRTTSDTEVLLEMLILYGEDALPHLNGMFAFVFYDQATDNWLMARDHFGIKPLYFTIVNDQLLLASEIKALLACPGVRRNADHAVLHEYLVFQLPLTANTMFEGIKMVQPASAIRGHASKIIKEFTYWEISFAVNGDRSEQCYVEELDSLLIESINQQCRSDVALGSYLSGGLDSSLVTSLASQYSNSPLKSFCGRFDAGVSYDESAHAKVVADSLRAELFLSQPTLDQFIDTLPTLIYMLDQPMAGPGVFPQFMVSKLAARHTKVVLGGQGGDEIFGGYARYLVAYLEQALKGAIDETQEEGEHLVTLSSIVPNLSLLKQYKPMLKQFWRNGLFEPMSQRYFNLLDRSPNMQTLLTEAFKSTFDRDCIYEKFLTIFESCETPSYINKMTYFDLKTLLPALLQVEDRVSMHASIESRVPILDRRIVELVAQMPPSLKFCGGKTKYILKKVAEKYVPSQIINRKDKMGFPVPLNIWWKEKRLKEFVADTLLSKKAKERNIFEPCRIEKLLQKNDFGRELWGLLSLELWYKSFGL